MEFKGTKGNWRIGVLGSVQNERGEFICESERNKATEEENKANNLLISKSPEMLEQLKEVLEFLQKVQSPASPALFLSQKIKNLIKEATTI